MKCQIPQISWHSRDPVLSVDFQPIQSDQYRLASGGTDSHVLIWYVTYQENNAINIECVSDLCRHNKSVNVVRFSPNGEYLVSGDDEGAMFVWQLKERELIDLPKDDDNVNKEEWYPMKLLRGHLEDIYDISWSKDSNFLVSASMDNTAIIWDMQKFLKLHIFSDFKGYVQGVSWDPCNQFIASVGSDRTLRIHNINSKKTISRISKAPWTNSTDKGTFKARLFYDDTLKSYCRRLSYTPDGELLIVPSGIIEKNEKLLNTCYIFSKHIPNKPVISLPTGDKYTIAVRCNPYLFKLRRDSSKTFDKENQSPKPLINLPYRMIFAVAACDSILMYDTEQLLPFAYISNIHYTHLTDLTWSPDGLTLVVSSTDGYCSFIVFTREEIGEIYIPEELKEVESEQILETCKNEKIDNIAPLDSTPVLEIEREKTLLGYKSTPFVDNKSPKTKAQNVSNECITPSSKDGSSIDNKKSTKKSPKMLSIKNFFVSPKTAVSDPVGDSTNKNIVKKLPSEIEMIDISDSPIKMIENDNHYKNYASSDKILSHESLIADEIESMNVDKNASDKEFHLKPQKQSKCKTCLDFNEKPLLVHENLTPKKSSKITIKNFFSSPKSGASVTTIDKSKVSITETSVKDISFESKSNSNVVSSFTTSVAEVKCNEKTDNLADSSLVNNVNNSKSFALLSDKEIIDVGKNTTDIVKPIAEDQVKTPVNSVTKVDPVVRIDENASDGVTSSSTSDLVQKESDNDWKLELSQDEDIVPMEVASAVPAVQSKVVKPKRRVTFVTLSSKTSFKK